MGRKTPTLPIASAVSPPRLSITSVNWEKIEAAYGVALNDPVRQAIMEVTNNYIEWGAFEHNAEPLAEARKRVEGIKKATAALIHELVEARQATDAHYFADRCIRQNLKDYGESIGADDIRSLCDALLPLQDACARALEELDVLSVENQQKWEYWAVWWIG